MEVQGYIQYSL